MPLRNTMCGGIVAGLLSVPLLADESKFPAMGDEYAAGRQIWLGTCASCHGYGIAGAPIPKRPKDWADRISKQQSELYNHAINGFFGKEDTYMPPRGGNEQLSDNEVRAAVDYMLALAGFYIKQQEKTK
ncbi:MAG: c-type cytochrome [Granulosicoccus sp.]|nr:c-type cytochrome [Granulosicoccus sp.]